MKKRNLVLQAALAAAFAATSSSAFSAVTLSTTAASVPTVYATELLQDNETIDAVATAALDLIFSPTWGVAAGNHLYVRIDLTNAQFITPVLAGNLTSNAAAEVVSLSAGGGAGSTFVIYDVSDPAGVLLTNVFTFAPDDLKLLSASSDISVSVRFYTDASAASTGSAAIVGTTLSDKYVTKGNAIVTTWTPATNTAVVTDAFESFAANTTTGTLAGTKIQLGKVQTTLSGALDPADSVAVVAADLATASDLVVTGVFGAVGTTGSVDLNSAANCGGSSTAMTLNTGKTTATATGFAGVSLSAAEPFVCLTVDGDTAVPAQVDSATLTYTGQLSGAVVPAASTATFGTILHDGAETWALNLSSSDNPTDATFLRISNVSSTDHGLVTGTLYSQTGAVLGSGTLVADLAANSTSVFTSAQIATALGATTWTGRAKLHIVAEINANSLRVQNLIRTGGVLTNMGGDTSTNNN